MNVDEYNKAMEDVLAFMKVNNFDYISNKYVLSELMGFVKMAGLNLLPFWTGFVARGLRRKINGLMGLITISP